MALVEKNIFQIRGKVGNNIYRVINGRMYVSALPKKYKISRTKAALAAREKFTFFIKLAKAIAANYILKMDWEKEKNGLNVYQKIMKKYYSIVQNYDVSLIALVRSGNLFTFSLSDVSVNKTIIDVLIAFIPGIYGIIPSQTPKISAQGFIYLYNPDYKRKDKFLFIPVLSDDSDTVLDTELSFRFKITRLQAKQMNLYPEKKLLFNLAVKDPAGKPMRFSETFIDSL